MAEEPVEGGDEGALRTIQLVDASNEPLECNVAAEFELDGQIYLVVTPTEEWGSVIRVVPGETEDEESLEELEVEEFGPIADAINGELMANLGLKIVPRGNELILQGEIPDDLYDDADELEVETDEGEDRTLLVLAEVDTGQAIYCVAANSGYILYPALQTSETTARPLEADELNELRDVFDEVYAQLEGGGDQEGEE
jgi:hypothetical protein